MNAFDAAVTAFALLAVGMGYRSGLLRSLATILGYVLAAPVTVALTPWAVAALGPNAIAPGRAWLVPAVIFVVAGMIMAALLRAAVAEAVGPEVGLVDRLFGALLGAVRILLLAVLMVVIFDRIIPADHEPAFLVGSKLRPPLSAAGRKGLQTLPPEVEDYIDQLKRERGL